MKLEGEGSVHTCVVSSVAGESRLLARGSGCNWMVVERDERKADRRRDKVRNEQLE